VYELLVMAAYPATQRFITTLMMMAKHGAFIAPNILFLLDQKPTKIVTKNPVFFCFKIFTTRICGK